MHQIDSSVHHVAVPDGDDFSYWLDSPEVGTPDETVTLCVYNKVMRRGATCQIPLDIASLDSLLRATKEIFRTAVSDLLATIADGGGVTFAKILAKK